MAVGAGGTSARRQWANEESIGTRSVDGALITHTDYSNPPSSHEWFAVTLAVDGSIAITQRFAVVPEVRVSTYLLSDNPETRFVRTRIATRWTF